MPDFTLLYDCDPRDGLARAQRRDGGELGRFEAVRLDFHERVREAYLAIARREPGRVAVIASSAPKEEVSRETWTRLAERFAL